MTRLVYTRTFLGMRAVIASPAMFRVMDLVEKVAPSDAAVLIQGESGSGKELIARAIHLYSRRAGKPWVDLCCAALPEHLIESELFGYEKGAFSGAESSKPGLIDLADQGTLFLDEIAELDPALQGKLLRVLDGIPYYRLGGTRKVHVDVRLVAATNRNLDDAVRSGRFRADLYHRLAQFRIEVPPLRRRLEDIQPIAEFFLEQQNPELKFSTDAIDALQEHTWPGNVRELRNVVTQSAVLAGGVEIQRQDLPAEIAFRDGAGRATGEHLARLQLALQGRCEPVTECEPILDGMERQLILKVLAETGGQMQTAADRLGISRRTLSRKLRTYREQGVADVCEGREA